MNETEKATTLVDGVPVTTAATINDAPAIRLTDDWEAAYHEDTQLIEVLVRDADPDGRHLFMELDSVIRAVPRAQLDEAIRRLKTSRPPTAGDETAEALRATRNLLAKYRRIIGSKAMLSVFHIAQIHHCPYSGETIDENEVDIAIVHADRILGASDNPGAPGPAAPTTTPGARPGTGDPHGTERGSIKP